MKKKKKVFINDILEVSFTAGIAEEPLQLESTPKIIKIIILEKRK